MGKVPGKFAVLPVVHSVPVLPIIHNGTVGHQVPVLPINDKGTLNL